MSGTDRYRLIEQLPDLLPNSATQTWLGTDLTLDRPVTIRLTILDSEPGLRLRLQTQSLASLEHPGLLHILDSYTVGRQLAVVTERLPAHTLADELSDDGEFERLAAVEALRAAATVARALHALHCAGFTHGGVSACQVGRRREGGFILLTGPPTADAVNIPATRRNDVHSVAALAHELLVGTPPRPRANHAWRIDSSVAAVVKPVLLRAESQDDPWPDAAALMAAINKAADELAEQEQATVLRRSGAAGRPGGGAATVGDSAAGPRWLRWAGAGALLRSWFRRGWVVLPVIAGGAVLLLGGWWLLSQAENGADEQVATAGADGSSQAGTGADGSGADGSGSGTGNDTGSGTGTSDGRSNTRATAPIAAPTTVPETTRVPAEILRITDFDPFGDDIIEHPERLLSLNNGDDLTGWHTSRYNSPNFGGLKDGVGLLVELGGEAVPDIAQVTIESPSTGWHFQLLASQERRATQIQWGEPVAELTVGPDQNSEIVLDFVSQRLRAGTLLLWITDLGDELETGDYRVTVTGVKVDRYHNP